MRKIVIAVLISVGLILVTPRSVFATASNLRCTPSTGTFKVGDTFTVEYALDTRSFQTFGANVVALFDTAVLEATTTQSVSETGVTGWGAPTTNTVDNTLGKITLDYGNAQPEFTGNTTLGKIVFKAVSTGQAQFNFQFFQQYDDTTPGVAKVWGKKDGTTLSNILTDVNNCIYVVEAGPTAAPTVPPGTTATPVPTLAPGVPTSVQQPLPTQLPRAGTSYTTTSMFGLGIFLIALGMMIPLVSVVLRK